jgi:ABC-type transporter Mla subunit MlaD
MVEKLTLPNPEIDEKEINVLPLTNPLVDVMDELELREETQQDEVFKMHVFLEDLSTMAKQVKTPLKQAEQVIEELSYFIKKCAEKSRELASIFDSVAQNYSVLEKNKTFEMDAIDIKIGQICADMKKGLFSMSGIYDHQHKHVTKLVSPMFKVLEQANQQDLQTLDYRSDVLKKFIHTQKQKGKTSIEQNVSYKDTTVNVEKLADMREERLKKLNESLYQQFIKRYNEQ